MPARELAPKAVAVGNCSGRDIDKFADVRSGPKPAKRVAAPLVAECFANLECGSPTPLVSKYNLFVLEVVKAWTDPAQSVRRQFTIADMAHSSSTAKRSR